MGCGASSASAPPANASVAATPESQRKHAVTSAKYSEAAPAEAPRAAEPAASSAPATAPAPVAAPVPASPLEPDAPPAKATRAARRGRPRPAPFGAVEAAAHIGSLDDILGLEHISHLYRIVAAAAASSSASDEAPDADADSKALRRAALALRVVRDSFNGDLNAALSKLHSLCIAALSAFAEDASPSDDSICDVCAISGTGDSELCRRLLAALVSKLESRPLVPGAALYEVVGALGRIPPDSLGPRDWADLLAFCGRLVEGATSTDDGAACLARLELAAAVLSALEATDPEALAWRARHAGVVRPMCEFLQNIAARAAGPGGWWRIEATARLCLRAIASTRGDCDRFGTAVSRCRAAAEALEQLHKSGRLASRAVSSYGVGSVLEIILWPQDGQEDAARALWEMWENSRTVTGEPVPLSDSPWFVRARLVAELGARGAMEELETLLAAAGGRPLADIASCKELALACTATLAAVAEAESGDTAVDAVQLLERLAARGAAAAAPALEDLAANAASDTAKAAAQALERLRVKPSGMQRPPVARASRRTARHPGERTALVAAILGAASKENAAAPKSHGPSAASSEEGTEGEPRGAISVDQECVAMQALWLAAKLRPWKLEFYAPEELLDLCDEHATRTHSLLSAPVAREAEPRARLLEWQRRLDDLRELLETLQRCHRELRDLEFTYTGGGSEVDVPGAQTFAAAQALWRNVAGAVAAADFAILPLVGAAGVLADAQAAHQRLEETRKALTEHLDVLQDDFPRFFFLSHWELASAIPQFKGYEQDPGLLEGTARHLFQGVKALDVRAGAVVAARSFEGEVLPFEEPIPLKQAGLAPLWRAIEGALRGAVRAQLTRALPTYNPHAKWATEWPAQVALVCSQLVWTREVEAAMEAGSVRPYLEAFRAHMLEIVRLLPEEMPRARRSALQSLLTINVHARDVLDSLANAEVSDKRDYAWISQLRYYWEDGVVIRMADASRVYGYEYYGSIEALVVTPLTDHCYRILLGAMHNCLGAALEGPAGTGKTETVKALAVACAQQCVVLNCSDSLDYLMLARFFRGAAQSAAWVCFDEFNRIDVDVLSVVAQQMLAVQRALQAGAATFLLEGAEVRLATGPTLGLFFTMNLGYLGRSSLPDSLKPLMRPVAVTLPDFSAVYEVTLFFYGFGEARQLAAKIAAFYQLARNLLSQQDQYDWGMRAAKHALSMVQTLKGLYPGTSEESIVLQALITANRAKLVKADVPLFDGLCADLFPGVSAASTDHSALLGALQRVAGEMRLQLTDSFRLSALKLYEAILLRHGVMLVGPPMAGKTALYRLLAAALGELNAQGPAVERAVSVAVINPKAVPPGRLLGSFTDSTQEWQDGVLVGRLRDFCGWRKQAGESEPRKWLVLDGPVDPAWVEDLNSLLDDNRVLTLMTGERLLLPKNVTVLFELQDLVVASPATISRVWIVFMDATDLGWRPLVESWLASLPVAIEAAGKEAIRVLVDWLVGPSLEFVRARVREPWGTQDAQLVAGLLRLLGALLEDAADPKQLAALFVFALVWTVGASGDEPGREAFDGFLRPIVAGVDPARPPPPRAALDLPDGASLYDLRFDGAAGRFGRWADRIGPDWRPPPGAVPGGFLVPTPETERAAFVLAKLVSHGHPALLVGPPAAGKTAIVRACLSHLPPRFRHASLALATRTEASVLQQRMEAELVKRARGVLAPDPEGARRLVVFLDDLNLPQREKYGSQPPLELVRQFCDHGGWYAAAGTDFLRVEGVQLVAAMGPPGGGRTSISARLSRHFGLLSIPGPSGEALRSIYTSVCSWSLAQHGFSGDVVRLAPALAAATVQLHERAVQAFLPTAARPHYVFTARRVGELLRGVLLASPQRVATAEAAARLWAHEALRVYADTLVDDADRAALVAAVREAAAGPLGVPSSLHWAGVAGRYEEHEAGELAQALQAAVEADGAGGTLLFRSAVEHAARASRTLTVPGCHAIVLGVPGSGRAELVRLAARLAGAEVAEPAPEWRNGLRRLMRQAAARRTALVLQESHLEGGSVLDDVSALVKGDELPGLFSAAERAELGELVRHLAPAGAAPTPDALHALFLGQCRQNLHLVLLLSPSGDDARARFRDFPALLEFGELPETVLHAVAGKALAGAQLEAAARAPLVQASVAIHASVGTLLVQFGAEFRGHLPAAPPSFASFLATFKALLASKRQELAEQRQRLGLGLAKLAATRLRLEFLLKEQEQMAADIARAQTEAAATAASIAAKKVETARALERVAAQQQFAGERAEEARAIKEACDGELARAAPALEAALAALDTLKPGDIALLRTMQNPPEGVRLVMEAVCVMADVRPVVAGTTSAGEPVRDYWEPAKKMLSDPDFIRSLRSYDKEQIMPSIAKTIEAVYLPDERFQPAAVRQDSRSAAAVGLCLWVHAIFGYRRVLRELRPKREAARAADALCERTMAEVAELRAQLQRAEGELAALDRQLAATQRRAAEAEAARRRSAAKSARGSRLLEELADERERWERAAAELRAGEPRLVGDVLLAAACVSYAGPFPPAYRERALPAWLEACRASALAHTSPFALQAVLGDPLAVGEWHALGLPADGFSTDNGVIALASRRWPLMIDPQDRANRWVKNMEKANGLVVLRSLQGEGLRQFEAAVRAGSPALVENVGEELEPALLPLLRKEVVESGGARFVFLGGAAVEYGDGFRLYLTSRLPAGRLRAELVARACVVSFVETPEGLEEQLLGAALAIEHPETVEWNQRLVQARLGRDLRRAQEAVLEQLSKSDGDLLEEEGEAAVERMRASHALARQIAEKRRAAEAELAAERRLRAGLEPVARAGATSSSPLRSSST
eukprot:tig00000248_g21807.t1